MSIDKKELKPYKAIDIRPDHEAIRRKPDSVLKNPPTFLDKLKASYFFREFAMAPSSFQRFLMVTTGVGVAALGAGLIGLPFINYSKQVRNIVGIAIVVGIGVAGVSGTISTLSQYRKY